MSRHATADAADDGGAAGRGGVRSAGLRVPSAGSPFWIVFLTVSHPREQRLCVKKKSLSIQWYLLELSGNPLTFVGWHDGIIGTWSKIPHLSF